MNENEIYDIACSHLGCDNDYKHDRDMFVLGFKAAMKRYCKVKDRDEVEEMAKNDCPYDVDDLGELYFEEFLSAFTNGYVMGYYKDKGMLNLS